MKKNKYKQLIRDLLFGLDEYGVKFEIINNPDRNNYNKEDSEFLRCPYAVRWTIPNSEYYCDKAYSDVMYINENGDGFIWWNEDSPIDIDNPAWFFIGYSNHLENQIKELKKKLQ